MKMIGLVGGVSWESSAEYYRLINQAVTSRLGALHSAELVMYSLDFEPVAQLEHEGNWHQLAALLIAAAQKLEAAGANFVVIASNTLHKVAPDVQAQLGIPLMHIADAVAEAVNKAGIPSVGLLGTRFVMEHEFYRERLAAHGLKIVVPPEDARHFIHRVIYDELALGAIRETSRSRVLEIIEELAKAGAAGIVLANTELPLLIHVEDTSAMVFDSMAIHVNKAVSVALTAEAV
jgi:aspartate racemase